MNSLITSIKNWVDSKGGWSHVIALGWALGIAAYAENTQFRTSCNHLYIMLPSWAHEMILGLAGLLAWYKTTTKSPLIPPTKYPVDTNDTTSKPSN